MVKGLDRFDFGQGDHYLKMDEDPLENNEEHWAALAIWTEEGHFKFIDKMEM